MKTFYTHLKVLLLLALFSTSVDAFAQPEVYYYGVDDPVSHEFTPVSQQAINTSSAAQHFTVEGTNLTDPIMIDAPDYFEVSLSSSSGFSQHIEIEPAGSVVELTSFYIRFSPTQVGTFDGNVTIATNGTNEQAIYVNGTAINGSATYYWNKTSAAQWVDANSWDPARNSIAPNDILIFDGTRLGNVPCEVIINASQNIGKLQLVNDAQVTIKATGNTVNATSASRIITVGETEIGEVLSIQNGSTLTLSRTTAGSATSSGYSVNLVVFSGRTAAIYGDVILQGLNSSHQSSHQFRGQSANSIYLKDGSSFTSNTFLSSSALPFGSVAGSAIFESGSIYTQYSGASPFGGSSATAVSTFQNGSTFVYQGGVLHAREYASLQIGAGAASMSGSFPLIVNQNLTVNASAGLEVTATSATTIKGNIIVNNNGNLKFKPSTAQTLTFSGTQQSITGGTGSTITFDTNSDAVVGPTTTLTLASDIVVNKTFTVNGTLNAGTYGISGSGTFSVPSTGSFITSHPNGLNSITATQNFVSAAIEFNGASTGTMPASVKKITINRAAGVTLSSPATVEEELVFTNGKLTTTSSNILTAKHNTSIIGANSLKYVAGPMKLLAETGNAFTFTFPIGSTDDYRPVSLTLDHNSSTPTTYTAEFKSGAPTSRTLPSTITSITDKNIYYTISKENGGSDLTSAYITMDAQDYDVASINSSPDPKVRGTIAKSNGSEWVDLGPVTGSTFNSGSNTISSTSAFTTFSDFVFATGSYNALPVTITNLRATGNDNNVKVEWTTATEKNSSYFDVERSSDAKNFSAIGRVASRGNSDYKVDYNFVDSKPLADLSYYRLRQVDLDGTESFFGPVAVRSNGSMLAGSFEVYPNPAFANINLDVVLGAKEVAKVRILNLVGMPVMETTITEMAGTTSYQLPVTGLQSGAYIVEVTTATGKTASRFVKQ